MSVHLLEKTAGGVLVNTVDVARGKTVEDTADTVRAEMIGKAFMEWFLRANAQWIFHVPLEDGSAVPVDLRQVLLKRLQAGGRISHIAGHLKVIQDGRSASKAGIKALSVGRDLLAWYSFEGARCRVGVLSLGALINHAWGLYFYKRKDGTKRDPVGFKQQHLNGWQPHGEQKG